MRARDLRRIALAALSITPSLASGYALSESHWNPSQLPIRYLVNASSAPTTIGGAAAVAALDAGMASWAAPVCTRWRTTNAGATSVARAQSGDRQNTFLWISNSWPAELGPVNSVIGVTTPVWTSGGYFIDADIQFNNVGFTWSTDGRARTVDTQSIATHEEGHFLGLDHSAQPSAVMYASYSGGIKRTLTTDDQGGVCQLYPSGMGTPDAGTVTPEDPCNRYTSCAGCTPVNNCGWCNATGQCVTSTASGPVGGSCGAGFVWQPRDCSTVSPVDAGMPPPVDAGPATDPCSRLTACGACTPYAGCGWCGASNSCRLGSATGPNVGTCASGWAWQVADCSRGTAAFGEPCTTPTDCSSGSLCVGSSATTAFCSRTCTDDCTCPRGYACNGRLASGQTVCVPGTNRCVMDSGTTLPIDSGVAVPDVGVRVDVGVSVDAGLPTADLGVVAMTDAGPLKADDAGTAVDTGGAVWMNVAPDSGCGCRVPEPSSSSRAQGAWALAAMAGVLTSMRRRRR